MVDVCPPWIYRRRRPELSVLYRALAHHFERFEQVYEERFESAFGFLRKVVQKSVFRFLDCGILEQGFARLYCKECRRSFAVAFSCRQRCLCPSCHQKRVLIWVDSEDIHPGAVGFIQTKPPGPLAAKLAGTCSPQEELSFEPC